ncbi:MAG TPA: hypothetical protein VFU23_02235, partial [Gemmatimonadales bacterium]|nr:hypothetical protein [Gemmatimonadales bacterium]
MILVLALVVSVGPLLQSAPPAPADTLRYTMLLSGNRAGSMLVIREADGSARTRFEFNDRGRGPKTETLLRIDAAGLPTAVSITGNDYLKAPVEEHFTVTGGTGTWSSSAERGSSSSGAGAFYVPLNSAPDLLGRLAQALLTAPGHRLPLLPAGEARIERAGEATVRRNGAREHLTAYAITGLDFTPTYVWLDDSGSLFVSASGWSGIVREGADSSLPALTAVQDSLERVRERRQAETLSDRPAGPVAFIGATLFDAPNARLAPGTTVVVDGNRISAVGPDGSIPIPPQARRIDARGKTLLPGLWDMHAHVGAVDGPLNIAAGITSVRDL